MSTPIRPDVHRRFRAVVARGLARADHELAAELARLRPARRQTDEERRRLHRQLFWPGASDPHAARAESDGTAD